jgi:hypothetical protein
MLNLKNLQAAAQHLPVKTFTINKDGRELWRGSYADKAEASQDQTKAPAYTAL